MTDVNKPPMFGSSFVIDPAIHEPRSGKSFWMTATATGAPAGKATAISGTIIGNCTTTILLKPKIKDGK